ncbi:MAG TPA: hypothetical protein VNN08_00685, partial [Thermoanaerobaculia bacterium]|nr:hypothetical protein [Thermoanaerobaculia bacterium]
MRNSQPDREIHDKSREIHDWNLEVNDLRSRIRDKSRETARNHGMDDTNLVIDDGKPGAEAGKFDADIDGDSGVASADRARTRLERDEPSGDAAIAIRVLLVSAKEPSGAGRNHRGIPLVGHVVAIEPEGATLWLVRKWWVGLLG